LLGYERIKSERKGKEAVNDAVANGVAELNAAKLLFANERDELQRNFGKDMDIIKADFATRLDAKLVDKANAVEELWREKLNEAEKQSAAAIALVKETAAKKTEDRKKELQNAKDVAAETLTAAKSSAEKDNTTSVAALNARIDELRREHAEAMASAEAGYAQALAAAATKVRAEIQSKDEASAAKYAELKAKADEYQAAVAKAESDLAVASNAATEKLAEVEAKYKEQMRRMSDEKDGALAASVASAGREADEISDRITAELEEVDVEEVDTDAKTVSPPRRSTRRSARNAGSAEGHDASKTVSPKSTGGGRRVTRRSSRAASVAGDLDETVRVDEE